MVSKTYSTWLNMRNRCVNPKYANFKHYGGKGIAVCERWDSYDNFLVDMGEKPDGLTLDRIKNDIGYNPSNCRWVTQLTQQNNRTNNHLVTLKGKTQTLSEWARELGISIKTVGSRIHRGWNVKKALLTPVNSPYNMPNKFRI